MSLTVQQFQNWLEDQQAIKCMLVEVEVFDGTSNRILYLSNKNYATGASDSPANTQYAPVINTGIEFTETLSLSSAASVSYGDIAVRNTNGEYDHWANWVWSGRPISIFLGDITFPRQSFTLIFRGVVHDIAFESNTTANIILRDVTQRLNTAITDAILGPWGTKGENNQNKEQIRPLTFGEVHNITPLLVDDVLLEYMVHNGPIESIIEVRDNGVPVEIVPNINQGTFRLVRPAVGTITCSVQGDRRHVDNTGATVPGYRNTVAKVIQRIITAFGKSSDVILPSEMNLASFNSFDAANQAPVGIYVSGKDNILSICQQLASSVGAQLVANRSGVLRIVRLDVPTTSSTVITDNDLIANTVSISDRPLVIGSVKINYCRNWTTQTGLLTNIPEEHKSLYSQEYLSQYATDPNVLSLYRLGSEVEPKNTLLISNANNEATNEANRLLNIFRAPRFIISIETTSKFLTIQLGDMVILQHFRYGLSAGRPGQVVSISTNWDTGISKLGVLV